MPEKHIGKVVQVMGPVLDIRFADGELPELLNAIELQNNGKPLIVEVAQHIGDNVVRCIAMNSTDGLVRGTEAVDTGGPIKVPVGDACLGRVFNLLGEPVDEQPAPTGVEHWPIHRPAPAFDEQESSTELLETGIKVVDLICPSMRLRRFISALYSSGERSLCRSQQQHFLSSIISPLHIPPRGILNLYPQGVFVNRHTYIFSGKYKKFSDRYIRLRIFVDQS